MARTEFPTKATHAQTRAHNASLVLRTVYDLGPISRAEVARLTGLTRTRRRRRRRARAGGPGPGSRARPLAPAASSRSCSRSSTMPARSSPSTSASGPSPPPSSTSAARSARDRARDLDGRDGDAALDLVYASSTTLARPHQPDPRHRRRDAGPRRHRRHDPLGRQPRLADLPLGALLRERYDLPDHRRQRQPCRGPREYLFAGEGRPANLVAIKVGRGIGAGLVLGGELFGGDGHGAGEIGHVVVEPTAPSAAAAASAASRRSPAPAPSSRRRAAASLDEVTPRLAAAAAAGDETALAVDARGRPALGAAIAALIGALNVSRSSHRQRHRPRRPVARRGPRRGHPPLRSARLRARPGSSDGGVGEHVSLSARPRC